MQAQRRAEEPGLPDDPVPVDVPTARYTYSVCQPPHARPATRTRAVETDVQKLVCGPEHCYVDALDAQRHRRVPQGRSRARRPRELVEELAVQDARRPITDESNRGRARRQVRLPAGVEERSSGF